MAQEMESDGFNYRNMQPHAYLSPEECIRCIIRIRQALELIGGRVLRVPLLHLRNLTKPAARRKSYKDFSDHTEALPGVATAAVNVYFEIHPRLLERIGPALRLHRSCGNLLSGTPR
jgi:hypothetical protein